MAVPKQAERSVVPGIARPTAVLAPTGAIGSRAGRIAFVIVLIFFSVVFTYPMIWLLSASFKTGAEVFSPGLLPDPVRVENYKDLLDLMPKFGTWFFNSVLVSALAAGA